MKNVIGLREKMLNLQDEIGMTVLHHAAEADFPDHAEILLSAGIDTEIIYEDGLTAVDLAAINQKAL